MRTLIAEGHVEYVKRYKMDLRKELGSVNSRLLKASLLVGRPFIVQQLILEGVDIDCINLEDFTPLMIASMHGHATTVHILLAAGANVNYAASTNGMTALITFVLVIKVILK